MSDDELARLREENEALREEVALLQQELDDLRYDLDAEGCHVAGLSAQIKALIAEGDACPNKAAHPLLERAVYINARTGEPMTKTRAYPLYREAFDAEAEACGIENPEKIRA